MFIIALIRPLLKIQSHILCTYIFSYKNDVPLHSSRVAHSFVASSMTVPFGHSHPLGIQI